MYSWLYWSSLLGLKVCAPTPNQKWIFLLVIFFSSVLGLQPTVWCVPTGVDSWVTVIALTVKC